MSTPFDVILADPPWRFSSNSEAKPARNPRRHYPCLRDAELAEIPVTEWAAPDAMLLLWTTSPMLERSMEVVRAWGGWRYASNVVWDKGRIGTGYWARNRHETLLLYKRGRMPCPKPTLFPSSVIAAPRREHSRKPDEVQDRIDAAWPDARKLEIFARRPREGWTVRGNDIDGADIRDFG